MQVLLRGACWVVVGYSGKIMPTFGEWTLPLRTLSWARGAVLGRGTVIACL